LGLAFTSINSPVNRYFRSIGIHTVGIHTVVSVFSYITVSVSTDECWRKYKKIAIQRPVRFLNCLWGREFYDLRVPLAYLRKEFAMKALGTLTAGTLSISLLLTPLCLAQEELGLPDKPAAAQPAAPPPEQAKTKPAAQEPIPLSSSKPAQQEIKISGSTIIGTAVKNAQGEDLGKIKDLMIDTQSGRVTSAVLAVGGTLGMGTKQVEIPWDTLKMGLGKEELVVEMDKDQLPSAETNTPSATAER
jgi:sporulation protein YlmC with PRC-barrel domain